MINKDLIEGKYHQMKEFGVEIDFLGQETFGQIMVFINQKPEDVLLSLEIDGDVIYVGTN